MKHHKSKPFIAQSGRKAKLPFGTFFQKSVFPMLAVISLLLIAVSSRAQVYSLSSLFTVPSGTGNIVSTANDRGLAYDSVSNLVYVSSSGGSIGAYNGTNGSYLGGFSFTGVSGGTFAVDQIGVARDGAIYGINLSTGSSSTPDKLYRWSSWTATATTAFNGNALANGGSIPFTSGRIGDTLAVTGSGANTLILAGVGTKPYFSLFYTADGLNYTNTVIVITNQLNVLGNVFGICFYTNNTFLIKSSSSTNSQVFVVQYPANYASQTVVTGAVLGVSSLGSTYNNVTFLSYAPGAGLLGTISTTASTSPVGLFAATNIANGVNVLATTTQSTPTIPGNGTGGAAFGGNGLTNTLYVLNTGNSLQAYSINLSSKPVITAFSSGVTNVFPPQTLTVSASGSAPLSYNWYSISGGTTNPIVNNTNFYTVATAVTNRYFVVVSNLNGSATSSIAGLQLLPAVTSTVVTQLWQVAPGTYSFLPASGDATRGVAYDTNSQTVVVSSTSGLFLLNGNTGATNGSLSLAGVTFGGLLGGCDQVAIADDGAVYAGNVASPGSGYVLYRWSAPTNTATATMAFSGDPNPGSGERWGDTMTARGSGVSSQILLASKAGTNVALLTPNDGTGLTYSSIPISVAGVPGGFAANGISFGSGNTFWAKSYIGDLYEIAFDPMAQTATVVFDYKQPAQYSRTIVGVGVDGANGILAGIDLADVENDVKLFQITGTADAPVLFAQSFFATANGNGNDNAAITMKYPRVYALDVNNGLVAINYGVPPTTAPTINTPPAPTTAYAAAANVTFSVSASGSLPLYYQWRFNSNSIAGATNSSITLSNPPQSKAGYYDVVVHNIAGSITSSPALLTLLVPVTSPLVTRLWSIAPGTNGGYLTTSGYETRGLAFDATTTNLLIADHSNIHVYSGTNGSYLFDLNTAGFPTGVNGWTVDQVGVADDGVVYTCDLSVDGKGFVIESYSSVFAGPSYAYAQADDLSNLSPGDRWGDTMAVRGSGPTTQILLGSYNGTNVVLFTTTDGNTFTPNLIPVQGGVPLGFAGLGIAFGPGNTFYAKGGHNYNLRQVAFDTNTFVGTVVQLYTAGTQVPNDLTGLGVDVTNNILGGVCYTDTPHDVQLFLLSGNTNAPYLFDQTFFPASNPNAQENSVVTLKGGLGFALDVNNGVVAFSYSLPAAPAVQITSVAYAPASVTLTWNNTFDGHGYQVVYKNNLLDATWTPLGTVTATDATATYTDTTATGATRFYRVISQ